MTSAVCAEEAAAGEVVGAGGATGAGRVQASSAVVELGRKLLQAARDGDTRAVLELMSRGAPFTTDWLGTSPLHLAAQHDHVDTCAVLLRAGISRDTRTKVERTPLHLAAYEGHAAVANLLLEHGALVDCRDMLRMTPLHWAAERGHTAVAETLLCHGADARAISKFGKTPLELSATTELRVLLERGIRRPARAMPPTQNAAAPTQPYTPSSATPVRSATQANVSSEEARIGTEEPAAKLLRRHGITLLPDDDSGTVLTALQSGRTVVLSDAGKLMLKESEAPPVTAATHAPRAGGVLLTATPVTTPPRPGVKIFTLPHKLVTRRTPLSKVKYVQLPMDAKAVARRHAVLQLRSAAPSAASPIKLVLHKNSANQPPPCVDDVREEVATVDAEEEAVLRSSDVEWLRGQVLAARATIARLRARLRAARVPVSPSPPPAT